MQYDEKVLKAFLKEQTKLFPKPVADTMEEADDFLSECLAVVVDSKKAVWDYFDDAGADISEFNQENILNADEVFSVGDGRYLIVEC
ncbi:MAG: glyoxalase [Lachnospiraceae bacterium]|nr:glyoxalase [Lachnospiraceae bacterium]